MEKTRHILYIEFWVPITVCLALIVPYENDWLLAGSLENEKMLEYNLAIAMELITICLIPVALRLFKFKRIKQSLQSSPEASLRLWGTVRMAMLTVPMMVNCWLYYQFMNVAFGYMGIIGLLSMMFVFPSRTRCEAETTDTSPKKEE